MGNTREKDEVDGILADWTRERPELDLTPMRVIGRILRLQKHLEPRMKSIFGDFGLNSGEFYVLGALRRRGKPFQWTPTELFKAMQLSSGAMTNRLDGLEKRGLIKRSPDPGDRRGTIITLTRKGLDVVDRAMAAHVDNSAGLVQALTLREQKELAGLLRKLTLRYES